MFESSVDTGMFQTNIQTVYYILLYCLCTFPVICLCKHFQSCILVQLYLEHLYNHNGKNIEATLET